MHELPSLSLHLDKLLTVNVDPGEPEDSLGHLMTGWTIPDSVYPNTPPMDLWAFYIVPALKALAEEINSHGDFRTKPLKLSVINPKNVVGFLSADGKVPVRLTIAHQSDRNRYAFIMDLFARPVSEERQ